MVIDVVAGRPARSSEDRLAVVEAAAVSETAVRTMVDDRRMVVVVVEDTEAVAAGPAMAPAAGEQERPMAAATVMELEERHRPGTHGSIKLERSRSIVSEWV